MAIHLLLAELNFIHLLLFSSSLSLVAHKIYGRQNDLVTFISVALIEIVLKVVAP